SKLQKKWGIDVLESLSLKGDENILDLGCGDGVLTAKLAALAPKGKTIGLDASRGMIETAKRQHAPSNLIFIHSDINNLGFSDEFDLIYSNAALHWILDHDRLLKNCYKALKHGGKIRWSFGGEGNCKNFIAAAYQTIALPRYKNIFEGFQHPWRMPSADEYIAALKKTGYSDINVYVENADRVFDDESEMIAWIDQPTIVPFLDYINDEKTKIRFRNDAIDAIKTFAKNESGAYMEIFRRINISAAK
ncbi:MAG: methyltransferase domain-containing protein, partial [Helicobacteraceae bacterium]|nr:methyltransferase domain-containing protein [Helicobacteraceae bacterium]